MAMLLVLALVLAAATIVYLTVRFLEPERATKGKAVLLVLLFALWNNARTYTGIAIPEPLDWLLYFAVTSLLVWLVFRLKPWNCVTAGSVYVVGRYLLMLSVSTFPAGFWQFFGASAD